jgi:hypothetical protein
VASRSARHSSRSAATSSGGVLTFAASLDDVFSRPSRISSTLRVLIEQSLRLECAGDFGDQCAAGAADVGERRQHPHGRGTESHDAQELDGVARGAAGEKVARQLAVAG